MQSNAGRFCGLCVLLSSSDLGDVRGDTPAGTACFFPATPGAGSDTWVLPLERTFSVNANLQIQGDVVITLW